MNLSPEWTKFQLQQKMQQHINMGVIMIILTPLIKVKLNLTSTTPPIYKIGRGLKQVINHVINIWATNMYLYKEFLRNLSLK
jgi:hypothetical protein